VVISASLARVKRCLRAQGSSQQMVRWDLLQVLARWSEGNQPDVGVPEFRSVRRVLREGRPEEHVDWRPAGVGRDSPRRLQGNPHRRRQIGEASGWTLEWPRCLYRSVARRPQLGWPVPRRQLPVLSR
jgi:hypothetical protein